MEWISLKVCPRSHFDGQRDVSHLPTRLAETEAPVLSSLPLESRQHTKWVQADSCVCPAASAKPLTSGLPITENKPAHPSQIRWRKPTCCVKRQVVADRFLFPSFSLVNRVVLQPQRYMRMKNRLNNPKAFSESRTCFCQNLIS